MRRVLNSAFIFSLTLFLSISTQAAELEQIGTFDFPSSGSTEAHKHFTLGVGNLHSFGWKQARGEFRKAQEIDPDFALLTGARPSPTTTH